MNSMHLKCFIRNRLINIDPPLFLTRFKRSFGAPGRGFFLQGEEEQKEAPRIGATLLTVSACNKI